MNVSIQGAAIKKRSPRKFLLHFSNATAQTWAKLSDFVRGC